MSFLDKLERIFGRFAIPNLALYLVIGQVFVLLATIANVLNQAQLIYAPVLVLNGEWWRVLTFMFMVPVPGSLVGYVFVAFGWYIFYMMAGALEHHWGTFRFNVYLFTSYALTLALSFVTPGFPVTNVFILSSVFLAFAYLNPNFEFVLFFILPVKVKWLALITVAWGVFLFIQGVLATRLQLLAVAVTYLLFFVGDILLGLKQGRRMAVRRAEKVAEQEKPRHVCYVCGKNDRTHPQLDFRYCSQCAGDQCYCPDHIRNHAHVVASDGQKAE